MRVVVQCTASLIGLSPILVVAFLRVNTLFPLLSSLAGCRLVALHSFLYFSIKHGRFSIPSFYILQSLFLFVCSAHFFDFSAGQLVQLYATRLQTSSGPLVATILGS